MVQRTMNLVLGCTEVLNAR